MNDDRPRTDLSITTPWRAHRTLLDPDRRLLEDDRVDNAVPPSLQVVLDSADVTVTSSEFGLSGLVVARRRYDYTKDIGLVGYFSDRSVGMHVGPRLHFGPPNDATTYRHNLYGFYTLETLRGDLAKNMSPMKSAPAAIAASSVSGVESPQIFTSAGMKARQNFLCRLRRVCSAGDGAADDQDIGARRHGGLGRCHALLVLRGAVRRPDAGNHG